MPDGDLMLTFDVTIPASNLASYYSERENREASADWISDQIHRGYPAATVMLRPIVAVPTLSFRERHALRGDVAWPADPGAYGAYMAKAQHLRDVHDRVDAMHVLIVDLDELHDADHAADDALDADDEPALLVQISADIDAAEAAELQALDEARAADFRAEAARDVIDLDDPNEPDGIYSPAMPDPNPGDVPEVERLRALQAAIDDARIRLNQIERANEDGSMSIQQGLSWNANDMHSHYGGAYHDHRDEPLAQGDLQWLEEHLNRFPPTDAPDPVDDLIASGRAIAAGGASELEAQEFDRALAAVLARWIPSPRDENPAIEQE